MDTKLDSGCFSGLCGLTAVASVSLAWVMMKKHQVPYSQSIFHPSADVTRDTRYKKQYWELSKRRVQEASGLREWGDSYLGCPQLPEDEVT